jgi:hypothetical protein
MSNDFSDFFAGIDSRPLLMFVPKKDEHGKLLHEAKNAKLLLPRGAVGSLESGFIASGAFEHEFEEYFVVCREKRRNFELEADESSKRGAL